MSKMKRRARGGKISGKDEIEKKVRDEADSDSGDSFKRGGRSKRATGGATLPARKAGGAISGASEGASLAKRARGGNIARDRGRFARGGSPMSAAHSISAPGGGGAGHEGADHPKSVP